MTTIGLHTCIFRLRNRRLCRLGCLVRVMLTCIAVLATAMLLFPYLREENSRKFEPVTIQTKVWTHGPHNYLPITGQAIPSPRLKSQSMCPADEIMSSSKVTKLGRYPRVKRFLSIGITSVTGPSNISYLPQTIQSLINNTNNMEKEETYIVIFLADLQKPPKSTQATELTKTFGKHIDQGLLIVIEAYNHQEYYPLLTNTKARYGDSDVRRSWRSKANVDVAFVMCYCKDLSQYYIHLEDDVISSPSFFPKLQDFLKTQKDTFLMLDVAVKGGIAKVYHSRDVANSASFYYLMYDEMPVDWLMQHLRVIKDPVRGRKAPIASLFQHIGILSSLSEKRPKEPNHLEPFFDLYDQKYRGRNPPANVTSSLFSLQGSPRAAYEKGNGYFWGKAPKKGDYVIIRFNKTTTVQRVFVDTGSYLGPKDLLKSGVLQASFELEGGDSCEKFQTIGSFIKGKVTITFDKSKNVPCLRILVTKNQNEKLFLREIDVWP